MARMLADLLKDNRLIALTHIFGIGPYLSNKIIKELGLDPSKRVKELEESEIVSIRDRVRKEMVEGDKRISNVQDIRRLEEIGSYRGRRHKLKPRKRPKNTYH